MIKYICFPAEGVGDGQSSNSMQGNADLNQALQRKAAQVMRVNHVGP